jgi:hypothetical protein
MRGRRGILVALLVLCACEGKGTAPAPAKSAEEQKQPATTKAEAEAAVEAAKAGAMAPPYPPLDPKLASSVLTMLDSAGPDPEHRTKTAAVGLKQLEQGRLPKELLDILAAIDAGTPDAIDPRISKGLTGRLGRQAFSAVCEGGDKVLDAVPAMAPAVQLPQLWKWCKLEGNGLLDRDEALAARSAPRLALAITIHGYIKARTEVHPVERQVLRMLATGK